MDRGLPHFSQLLLFFFFNDTATTEIYTLSLHDALPISWHQMRRFLSAGLFDPRPVITHRLDRKSTRLNSSHSSISYAVFCLKKKKKYTQILFWSHASSAPRTSPPVSHTSTATATIPRRS